MVSTWLQKRGEAPAHNYLATKRDSEAAASNAATERRLARRERATRLASDDDVPPNARSLEA
jgi:hypothetical protein